jgi:hypothetical protein
VAVQLETDNSSSPDDTLRDEAAAEQLLSADVPHRSVHEVSVLRDILTHGRVAVTAGASRTLEDVVDEEVEESSEGGGAAADDGPVHAGADSPASEAAAGASSTAASSSGDDHESSLRASTRAAVTFDVGSAANAHRAARDATARLVNETMWTWHCANTQNTPLPNADFVFWKDKQTAPVLTYVPLR